MFPRRVQPLWQYRFSGSASLARLGFLEGLSRALLSVVVPLTAFETFGSRRAVSFAYVGAAAVALGLTLSVGWFERRVARRWIATAALIAMTLATAATATGATPLVLAGLALLASGTSLFSYTVSLFIMESIGKDELQRSETVRVFHIGGAWLIGPALGVWLATAVADNAPYVLTGILLTVTLFYFWVLRLGANPALSVPKAPPPNPMLALTQFFDQRYLRIAYLVTLVRAMFWVALFIFAPPYLLDAGVSIRLTGVFISGLAGLLLLSPAIGRLAEHQGTRPLLVWAYIVMGTAVLGLAFLGEPTATGMPLWAVAALCASVVDVLGNIPFMRTVRPKDRIAMTSVFSTWRDTAYIATPLLAAVVLSIGSMRSFYAAFGLLCLGTAGAASLLPRRI